MIPLRLEIEGFLAYRSKVILDFSDFQCAVIIGENGAGKSTILDAILFALYGKARDAERLDDLINNLSSRATINFFFSIGGENYYVYREKERGKESRVLFFRVDPLTGNRLPFGYRGVRAIDEIIRKTVGLTYDAFTSSALLVQGKSDNFLTARSGDRKDVLTEILGLKIFEKIFKKSSTQLREINLKMSELKNKISSFLDVNDEQCIETKQKIETIKNELIYEKETLETINQAIKLLSDRERALRERNDLESKIKNHDNLLSEKEIIERSYNLYDDSRKILPYLTRKKELKEEIRKFINLAREYPLKLENTEGILKSTFRELDENNKCNIEFKNLIEKLDLDVREQESKVKAFKIKKDDLIKLEVADICPLCGYKFTQDRKFHFNEEKKILEEKIKESVENLRISERELNIKRLEQRHLEDILLGLNNKKIELDMEIRGLKRDITKIAEDLETRKRALTLVEEDIEREKIRGNSMVGSPIRDVINILQDSSIVETYKKLNLALTQKEVLQGQIKVKEDELARIEKEFSTLVNFSDNLPELIKVKKDKDRLISEMSEKLAGLNKQLGVFEEKLRQKKSLIIEIENLTKEEKIYSFLSDAFSGKNLQTIVVKKALLEIGRHSDELLKHLSGGRLSLVLDSANTLDNLEILIKDLSTQENRKFELLSGGEKFRVSLSIALGIGRYVSSQTLKTIESIFIDEGFGALDRMGRETLIEVIRALLSEIKMIIIVTHLDDIADAFPVQIKVQKKYKGESSIEIAV